MAVLLSRRERIPVPGCSTHRFNMGKIYESIDEKLRGWLSAQKVFFVATAPLSREGHVNCSPKDGDSFRVIDERTVVYLDLTGSGVETIAHVKENERIVLMFCAFAGAPKIVRLHGHGEIIEPRHPEFEQFRAIFSSTIGIRSFIKVHLNPNLRLLRLRRASVRLSRPPLSARDLGRTQRRGIAGEYRLKLNSRSIDQLEGIESGEFRVVTGRLEAMLLAGRRREATFRPPQEAISRLRLELLATRH